MSLLEKKEVFRKKMSIDRTNVEETTRIMKVPFGWILETSIIITTMLTPERSNSSTISQTFISDPNHEWDIFKK